MSLLSAAVRSDAVAVATEVTARVDPVARDRLVFEIPGGRAGQRTVVHSGSFAHGGLGIALLLHAAREFGRAPLSLSTLAEAARNTPPVSSVFDGFAGLYAVLRYLSDGPEFVNARATVGGSLLRAIAEPSRWDGPPRMDRSLDVINGIAGVALVVAGDDACPELPDVIAARLRSFSDALDREDPADRVVRPLDLGLSHGIAGLIAATAASARVDSSRHRSLRALCEELIESGLHTREGPAWASSQEKTEPARVAWCYGTPGISVALFEAADVLGDESIAELASRSVARLSLIERSAWRVEDYGICHGLAGIALCLGACMTYAGAELQPLVDDVVRALIRGFDERSRFGYRSFVRPAQEFADDPGLLMGAAGVALSLLTLAGVADPSWARSFGIGFRTAGFDQIRQSPAPDRPVDSSTCRE